jgi:hypothetical protein
VAFVGNPQGFRVELIERIDKRTELRRFPLDTRLEGIDRATNDLPRGHAKRARFCAQRSPLFRGHQNHQPRGRSHGMLYMHMLMNIVSGFPARKRASPQLAVNKGSALCVC